MQRNLLLLVIIGLLASCTPKEKFLVSGIIGEGAGETIYLIHNGLSKNTILDSIQIKKDGSFQFKSQSPEYPDFYSLKLNNKHILFAVDSTEHITINSSLQDFAQTYDIEGSEANKDIQFLRASANQLSSKVKQLSDEVNQKEKEVLFKELTNLIEAHKSEARAIILKNPLSTAAYFAIYQKVNDTYLFSPYEDEDRSYCAAVATSYNTFMPDYIRSKNLTALVLDAIKSNRRQRSQAGWRELVETSGIGYIDIELADVSGKLRKLSDLSGKLILLDFSAYAAEGNIEYTFELRSLYEKYASKGFQIYQVSLDASAYFWEDIAKNLPWITVRDENGQHTRYASSYNLQQLPTHYLIDRQGDIVAKNLDFPSLRKEIEKRL